MDREYLFEEAVNHLQHLIATPSFSDEEGKAADIWEEWLRRHEVKNLNRFHNNVYALPDNFQPSKPILLLNSHMDTVRPVASYTRDPFEPTISDGVLWGLGSNDAGGAGVCLASTFLSLKNRTDLPFNLLLAITASEERMGDYGMRAFLPHLKEKGLYPQMAIVGEPTSCEAAIAERGLVVCDVMTYGKAGHVARNEGDNAIYHAIKDIEALLSMEWPKESKTLGPVKASVTMINAGTQHNVVPDRCHYVVDIRTTDAFSNEETVELISRAASRSVFCPRSTRIRASVLAENNPLFKAARQIKMRTFVSPTTSDMALMPDIPSIKIGPGESKRSHSADEFILLSEIRKGLETYENFLQALSEI